MNRFVSTTVACGLFAMSAIALADEVSEAQRLFDEGQALFEQGKVDEACDKLQRSVDLDRAIGAVVNLARCHAAQGKIASAVREYREVAKRARAAGQMERAEVAEKIADDLLPTISKLAIEIAEDHPGLAITIDGEPVAKLQLAEPIPLDPGTVVVRATAPGRKPFEELVQVPPAGEVAAVRIPALERSPSRAPSQPASDGLDELQIGGIVVGSAGLAMTIVGGVLGGLTLSDVSTAEDDPSLCPQKQCTPEGLDHIDGARAKGIASTILLAAGVAAIGGGVAMLLLGGDADEEVTATVGIDGLTLRW